MEYNVESMCPLPEPSIIKRLWDVATSPNYSRTLGVLALLILVTAVPLISYVAQQQTRSRQQAAGSNSEGKVEFLDKNGTILPATISDPNVYLRITLPEEWNPPLASVSLAQSNQNTLVKTVYAEEDDEDLCAEHPEDPACSPQPTDQFLPTPTQGQSAPTTTPGSVQCVQMRMEGRDGTNFYQGDILIAKPIFTGRPKTVVVWVSGNENVINPTPGTVGDWTRVAGRDSSPDSGITYIFDKPGQFYPGKHIVMMELRDGPTGIVLDDGKIHPKTCATTFNLLTSGDNTPTQTPSGGTDIFPQAGAQITGNTVQLRWSTIKANYHVRVNNQANQTALAVNVSRESACPNNLFVCHFTNNHWLDIPLPNNGIYAWWVDKEGQSGHFAEGSFTVSGSSGGTEQTATLTKIDIQNTDSGSDGHPKFQIQPGTPRYVQDLADAKSGKLYWMLNPNGSNPKTVSVNFYARDSSGNELQKTATVSIALTGGGGTTAPTPTTAPGTTGVCRDLTPDQTQPASLVGVPDRSKYIWKVAGGTSCSAQPSCYNGEGLATRDDKCLKNESQLEVDANTSRWCYGFQGPNASSKDFRCLQLRYIGSSTDPTPTPTPPSGGVITCTTAGNITISGTVKKPDVTGQANALVCLDPSGNGSCIGKQQATTNADGTYAITNVVPGGSGHTVFVDPTSVSGFTVSNNGQISKTCTNDTINFILSAAGGAPTATPAPAGGTKVSFSVNLQGIGNGGSNLIGRNNNPAAQYQELDATVLLFDPTADTKTAVPLNGPQGTTRSKALIYTNGTYRATDFDFGTFTPTPDSKYQVLISVNRNLRKKVPGIQIILTGTTKQLTTTPLTLIAGDVTNDNKINVYDYEAYRTCFISKAADCVAKVDLNDDGKIDTTLDFSDYRLLLNSFTVQEGD